MDLAMSKHVAMSGCRQKLDGSKLHCKIEVVKKLP